MVLAYSPIQVQLAHYKYSESPRHCSCDSADLSAPAIPASSSSSASTTSSDAVRPNFQVRLL
ncbi:hypothetical protein Aspvir_009111 [Aspergillus viridinutans]|uniref:Uncharacterized protein n=1 Tax=Aspergillus viridinutans TaxID=75553 RepID=A0A9P3C3C9_ASPVI|nr:uncharacterized protein Aspvir_009111 [Aspergillus viridinutans]GIK05012.1 hypothetical protein Aspvir_009111 [Aspergillus viridinutans]